MRVSVLLRTSEFRGDHAADVSEAHEVLDGETVQALADRLLNRESVYAPDRFAVIEIRRLVEAPPKE